MAPKGVSNRTLLAKKKGIKMGSYIKVSYREDGKGSQLQFEGVMADRRIGGTDRESYIELKNAIAIGKENEIIAFEGIKRLVDAFIDDMDPAERRAQDEIGAAQNRIKAGGTAALQPGGPTCPGGGSMGNAAGAAAPMAGGACHAGCGCAGCGCCGCGGCGCGSCGCGGCGCGGCGCGCGCCGCGGCGCGMPACGCGCGCGCGCCMPNQMMGMNPMMGMMGGMSPMMGMMNPMMGMMNPMGMAMGAMGMAAMMAGNKGDEKGSDDEEDSDEATDKTGKPTIPEQLERLLLPGLKGGDAESPDISKELENIDEGSYVSVQYTHPQLGKVTYEGALQENFIGATTSQSYIRLSQCRRYGKKGRFEGEEAMTRLMTGFVDAIQLTEPRADRQASRSRSRSRSRDKPGTSSPARS